MAYPRSALALVLLLAACPGGGSSGTETESGTGSVQTSMPGDGSEGPCPDGGLPCGSECVFLGSDENNCGACGNVCGQGEECIAAMCVDIDPCDGAPGTPCGPECVDLDSNPNHCGDCYNGCGDGEACSGGMCIPGGNDTGPPPETDSGPSSSSGEPDPSTSGSTSGPASTGGGTSGSSG